MVQLYCSEQIAVPETFPNILKTYAKAAIRTQPYDVLRWSAAYFRSLANKAPPPVKIRLERECRQGGLTKGYLRALIAQVGKGFFISRCLLQEKWKALCLPEEELLKHLSLCRMLHWPQVHWLKVVAVMAASLCPSPHQSMIMICELLTDDVEGGVARLPYWMLKICYNFIAELDCTQEQCFVNGQLVLPWGDLEEPRPMDRLPRVLSSSMLKDTIIKSCKAKFRSLNCQEECDCPVSLSSTETTNFMINSELGDPNELLAKCEDFDTIMLLLADTGEDPVEVDSKGPHYISEKQMRKAQEIEAKIREQRDKQSEQMTDNVREFLDQEAIQMLREVGPPWTWLHQFATANCNAESFNFVDLESIQSDLSADLTSAHSFDFVKEDQIKSSEKNSTSSFCPSGDEVEASLESLKSLVVEAAKENKCDIEETSSVVSYLKSDELSDLYKAEESLKSPVDLQQIVRIVERAASDGMTFSSPEHLMEHVKLAYLGNLESLPSVSPKHTSTKAKDSAPKLMDDAGYPGDKVGGPVVIPPEWQETIPKQVEVPPRARRQETPKEVVKDEPPRDEMTTIFETTVGIPPEQAAKMPKFCFETKDADDLILGLVAVEEQEEDAEEEDVGSPIPESGTQSLKGYRSDDSDIFPNDSSPPRQQVPPQAPDFYCCVDPPTLAPKAYVPPLPEFRCTIDPIAGIGAAVPEQIKDKFLAYLRERAREQQGLVHPRNFTEESCPHMVDTAAI